VFARTKAEREDSGDPRLSIEERYRNKHDYVGRITQAALDLVNKRYLLAVDLPEIINQAGVHYDWVIGKH